MHHFGSQYPIRIPILEKKELDISVKYSPIRHPQSNTSDGVMKEIGKFCGIYCNQTEEEVTRTPAEN
jgi:hypothetical protein